MLRKEFENAIEHAQQTKKLDLTLIALNTAEVSKLAEFIKQNKELLTLSMTSDGLTLNCLNTISKALQKNFSILQFKIGTRVNLAFNEDLTAIHKSINRNRAFAEKVGNLFIRVINKTEAEWMEAYNSMTMDDKFILFNGGSTAAAQCMKFHPKTEQLLNFVMHSPDERRAMEIVDQIQYTKLNDIGSWNGFRQMFSKDDRNLLLDKTILSQIRGGFADKKLHEKVHCERGIRCITGQSFVGHFYTRVAIIQRERAERAVASNATSSTTQNR